MTDPKDIYGDGHGFVAVSQGGPTPSDGKIYADVSARTDPEVHRDAAKLLAKAIDDALWDGYDCACGGGSKVGHAFGCPEAES